MDNGQGLALGDTPFIWPIRVPATGQGVVFGLSVPNRVYNLMRVCPEQDLNFS